MEAEPSRPERAARAKDNPTPPRVAFVLHGIRTHAPWQRAFSEVAQSAGWKVRSDRWNFGYFSVLRLLLPGQRLTKVKWFREIYHTETNDKHVGLLDGNHPSIVAHSFGTYILGNALLKYDWLRFDKVILCGSILPQSFPWDTLIERGQVRAVRNEFGTNDFWTRIVGRFVAGAGPAGYRGFHCKHPSFQQEEFLYDHSEYFEKGHMEAKWLPFLNGATPTSSNPLRTQTAPAPAKKWNVPFSRNPFFTGREKVLEDLRRSLTTQHKAALSQIQAISGLGGIGKTQTAVEYAYRFRDTYNAVLWVHSNSREKLLSGFVALAQLLNLPEKDEKDTAVVVSAVKLWLDKNAGWLLILDNADEPKLVEKFIPHNPQGHVLLTSRSQGFRRLGISKPLYLEKMEAEEALEFLFKSTGGKTPDQNEQDAAANLAHELGYLPLALEQAAAYLAEKQVRFSDYLAAYRKDPVSTLENGDAKDHPVATTWILNFLEVENASQASADLLRLSAFLSPDAIPFELLQKGAAKCSPSLTQALAAVEEDPLLLSEILTPLTCYSLIRVDLNSQSYSIHRLVQVVAKARMDEATRRLWAERAVRALNEAFSSVDISAWLVCERLLSQALAVPKLLDEFHLDFTEAARLLQATASYLCARASYTEAEPLFLRALKIYEHALGPAHLRVAIVLNDLATALYYPQGKLAEAESLLQRALKSYEHTLGPDHFEVATSLNNLAMLYHGQGKLAEAEPLYRRSLAIQEKSLGPDHPNVASTLGNLATLYRDHGKLAEAEALYRRALKILEKSLGPDHPNVASTLGNLALLYHGQGKHAEAEPLFLRALKIYEHALGPEDHHVDTTLYNLVLLYHDQGKHAEAEPFYRRLLAMREKTLGRDHPDVANSLNNLAGVYCFQRKLAEAEPLYQRALKILEKSLGPEHPNVALLLHSLATLYFSQSKLAEADPLFRRSLAIREKALGSKHPDVANSLQNYSVLLRATGRETEAKRLEQRAKEILAWHAEQPREGF